VDPADFSHGFCDYMAHAAYTHKAGSKIGPRSLMQRGYEDICKDKSVPAGGSTACVAIAKEDGELSIANLGDSGYIQLRLNAIHNASEPQTHAFNTPYQLSVIPERMLKQAAAFGGQQLCDMPKDANVTRHEMKHGDVLIIATDGVWDNLAAQDILKISSEVMLTFGAWEKHATDGIIVGGSLRQLMRIDEGEIDTEELQPPLQTYLAAELTAAAKSASVNTKVDGPFAREVHKYYPDEDWRGGKVDDICVVVAVVCEENK
jgi:protein phosphatase PTC7